MYTLSKIPDETNVVRGDLGRGEGVVGVMSGRSRISLHEGSLVALQAHHDGHFEGMKVCFASSADTPLAEKIGRGECWSDCFVIVYILRTEHEVTSINSLTDKTNETAALKLLEVVPGTTVWDLVVGRDWNGVDVNQIGRQPPLSSNKSATHFPILRDITKIRYDRMLFFDDCQWGDHCGQVERACKESETGRGVVTVRTPYGLRVDEWNEGLGKYAKLFQE